ncbi:MAG: hypothetical protein U1C74_08270 [Phenylobacterium sp.]|nr:hypothetical protein [Phenylobacterium sp.]
MRARAALWIAAYLALVAAPLVALLAGPMPPGVAFWWDFSMALGFAGMAVMGVQFALTARFRRASAPFGVDIIYFAHRYLAIFGLLLALSHFGILWSLYPDALGALDPRKASFELTLGRAALVLFALAVITSQWRSPLGLEYRLWRISHVLLATLGFAAAVGHILGVGYYTDTTLKRVLWLTATLFWLLLILWTRLVKPWRSMRRPYRVAEVREERGETWTLALEPDGHRGLEGFKPGQFAWLSVRRSPFALAEHPFTISSPPEQLPRVEFTIKALGDFTESIGDMKPGELAYLDGPYGVFSIDRRTEARGYAFIVGGVGITPALSMLRSLAARGARQPLWLFYANKSWDDVIAREAIDALSNRLPLTVVHVLEEPPEDWSGESGLISKDILERWVPAEARGDLHYFLCGPPPMIAAAETHLTALGVHREAMQVEVFDLV